MIEQVAAEEISLSKELAALVKQERVANATASRGLSALQQARTMEKAVKAQAERVKVEHAEARAYEIRGADMLHAVTLKMQKVKAEKLKADAELAKLRASKSSGNNSEDA